MRTFSLAAAVFLIGPGTLTAQEYPHAFPREGATKILENDRVVVWEVFWPNNVAQPVHEHQYDLTGVFLRWGPLRVTSVDGTARENHEPFEIPNPFYQGKGVTHVEEGIGEPERHSISIDIKDGRPTDLDPRLDLPEAFPREGAEARIDNERVTIWHYSWPPSEKVAPRYWGKDAVVTFLNPQPATLLVTYEDGTEERLTVQRRNVRFWPRDRVRSEEVLSGTPEAMIFELN